ncbi:class I SAM-dependent methyltransferase [bacterium]|nr:class I SAM-dependent methyltransferase [FCB group bacterium]MBL7190236.1 class I SAM-dependent methyltransferase [bacterium]
MGYYSEKLSADKLKRVYDLASPRVVQYLRAEAEYILRKVNTGDRIIELGCGYGRVLPDFIDKAGMVIGIDTSYSNIAMGNAILKECNDCHLLLMDAALTGFKTGAFDMVFCIQNGISAFKVDQKKLIHEAFRLIKPGGTALFSSYSDKFWNHRLQWFQTQSEAGLLGGIDYAKTKDGVIVCKDGFQASTIRRDDFNRLTMGLVAEVKIEEVDESSLFYEIRKN